MNCGTGASCKLVQGNVGICTFDDVAAAEKNLRNVGIPGIGIPLSRFCISKWVAYCFFFVFYPFLCFTSAILRVLLTRYWVWKYQQALEINSIQAVYRQYLLCPQDWFNFWRLNCCLASYHSLMTKAAGYVMEDKWEFMKEGAKIGLPIAPWLDIPELIVKDKNEEGGMGVKFFQGASHGGTWIFQERIQNSDEIARLLPPGAPLSTCRVITASRGGLTPHSPRSGGSAHQVVSALSCVFRAGLANALTDHQSILFDVDKKTGIIGRGLTNKHWYKLGFANALPNLPSVLGCLPLHYSHHPDTNVRISGESIVGIEKMLDAVVEGHYRLFPDVPLAGWDVALTPDGIRFIEINLSCNFFKGTFDQEQYFKFMNDYFNYLDDVQKPKQS